MVVTYGPNVTVCDSDDTLERIPEAR